jgi:hypothetical protein
MGPEEAASLLREELEECFADLTGWPATAAVVLRPPQQLRADESFQVSVRLAGAGSVESELPVNLALGYLADEEAAVDEWRLWVHELVERLGSVWSKDA